MSKRRNSNNNNEFNTNYANTIDEDILIWLSWKIGSRLYASMRAGEIDSDWLCNLIKDRAYKLQKAGKFNFTFMYEIEKDVLDFVKADFLFDRGAIRRKNLNLELTNIETGDKLNFKSMIEVAQYLNVTRQLVSHAIKNNTTLKNKKYYLKKLE